MYMIHLVFTVDINTNSSLTSLGGGSGTPGTTTLNQEFSVNGGTVNLGSCTGYTQYVSNVSNSGGHTGTYLCTFKLYSFYVSSIQYNNN